jgi:hypothetical protein
MGLGRRLLVLVAVLLALGLVVAGCRKDGDSGGGTPGYLPAPSAVAPAPVA